MLRLETLTADLGALRARLNLTLRRDNAGREVDRQKNAREGAVNVTALRVAAPDAIRKLVAYLRQDFVCLGYPEPTL